MLLKEAASNADEQYSKICKRREWGGEVISLSGDCSGRLSKLGQ